jgi:hypothetical protein
LKDLKITQIDLIVVIYHYYSLLYHTVFSTKLFLYFFSWLLAHSFKKSINDNPAQTNVQ